MGFESCEMEVNVELYANFKKYSPIGESTFKMQLESDATVKIALEVIKIPSYEKAIVLINGRHADALSPLKEKDTITLFSPMSGG